MSTQIISKLLSEIDVGILPRDVFYEIARLIPLSAVEIVPLRSNGESVEVLLLKRPHDDPHWPGLWHTPGSIVRAYDTKPDFKDAIERVLNDELLAVEVSKPVFVNPSLNQSARGKEVGLIYWVEVKGNPTAGKFFDVTELPTNRVPSQPFIQDAVATYIKSKP